MPPRRKRSKSENQVKRTPEDRAGSPKTPRSSSRLKDKRNRKFNLPSREKVWKDIDEDDKVKTPKLVQPRRLADSFSRVTHSYNRDRFDTYETSDDESMDDFIDDDDDDDLADFAPVNIKFPKRQALSSESSSESEDEPIQAHTGSAKKSNRINSDSDDSDNNSEQESSSDDFDIKPKTNNRKGSILESSPSPSETDSDTEDYEYTQKDLNHDEKQSTKDSTDIKKRRSLIRDSDSDDGLPKTTTTPYKSHNRIVSESSDDEHKIKTQETLKIQPTITGETNTEFENDEIDSLVTDCLKIYEKYNNPLPSTSKTEPVKKMDLFDAVLGTEQGERQVKPVIASQESVEPSIGDLANLSDENEDLNLKSRPRADRRSNLRQKFSKLKNARSIHLGVEEKYKESSSSENSGSESESSTDEEIQTSILPQIIQTPEKQCNKNLLQSNSVSRTPSKSSDTTGNSSNQCSGTCDVSGTSTNQTSASRDVSATSTNQTSAAGDVTAASTNECSVCMEREIDCVFVTCGHMCACYACARHIHTLGDNKCPICRTTIENVIKVYKSCT